MSTQVKLRRDVEGDCADATPAEGEIWIDTTNKRPRIGDGLKQGGFPIPTVRDMQNQTGIALTVTGSGSPEDSNTLTGSSGSANSGLRRAAYVTNERIGFFAPGANTGPVTINRDGLGDQAIERGGSALTGGEIIEGHWTEAVYDGTAYQLVLGGGKLLQTVYDEYAGTTGITATIAEDDSVPLVSEGTQILSKAITPGSATNRLQAAISVKGAVNASQERVYVLVFAGSTLVGVLSGGSPGTNVSMTISGEVEWVSGSASPITVSVRVAVTAGTFTPNGTGALGRLFDGRYKATMSVRELGI